MKIYSTIASNKWKTILIMVLFVVFVTTIGFIFEKALGYGTAFLLFALLLAIASSVCSYFFSDKLVLATSRAQEIQKKDNPELFNVVQNLCIGDGLPMPKIYIMDEEAPNAFATGRDPKHAVVCVTAGILKRLNKAELEGVIAHELSHVKEYDIRLMSVVAILVGFIAILADLFMVNLFCCSWRCNEKISENCNKTDRKSTRLNSSHQIISYAVFCLKKKKKITNIYRNKRCAARLPARAKTAPIVIDRIYDPHL